MLPSTSVKLGRPCMGWGGKYVPAQKGLPCFGSRKTLMGQPPLPVMIWVAVM